MHLMHGRRCIVKAQLHGNFGKPGSMKEDWGQFSVLGRSDALGPRSEGCGPESLRKKIMRFSPEASLED